MAENINDGGRAFPVHPGSNPDGGNAGMSLRDWFAGLALAGFACTADEELPMNDGESVDAALARYWAAQAKTAYIAADAMLAAREAR